jgi:hypothetical protein
VHDPVRPGPDNLAAMSENGEERPDEAAGWRRWSRPFVVLVVVTAALAVVSVILNRRPGTDDPAAGVRRTTTAIAVARDRYGCVADGSVLVPYGSPPPGYPLPSGGVRVSCGTVRPGPPDAAREPVTPAAAAVARARAVAVNAVLDALARDCAVGARHDPGCPHVVTATVHVSLPPGQPLPELPAAPRPMVTDAYARLARATLAAAGYRTVVVRVAMPYDPAPAGSLVWALDTGDACAVGYSAGLGGGIYHVLGTLADGACLR